MSRSSSEMSRTATSTPDKPKCSKGLGPKGQPASLASSACLRISKSGWHCAIPGGKDDFCCFVGTIAPGDTVNVMTLSDSERLRLVQGGQVTAGPDRCSSAGLGLCCRLGKLVTGLLLCSVAACCICSPAPILSSPRDISSASQTLVTLPSRIRFAFELAHPTWRTLQVHYLSSSRYVQPPLLVTVSECSVSYQRAIWRVRNWWIWTSYRRSWRRSGPALPAGLTAAEALPRPSIRNTATWSKSTQARRSERLGLGACTLLVKCAGY